MANKQPGKLKQFFQNTDWGMAGIGFGTGMNFATSIGSAITQGDMSARMGRMQAEAYRSQARMAILQAEQANANLNASAAQDVWNVYAAGRQFQGTQRTAMAASGFTDISSGDYALIAETARQTDEKATGIATSAYLQSFENTRAARMEAVRLEYAARSAEVEGRMQKKLSRVNAVAGALGSLAQGAVQYGMYTGLTGSDLFGKGKNSNGNYKNQTDGLSKNIKNYQKQTAPWLGF